MRELYLDKYEIDERVSTLSKEIDDYYKNFEDRLCVIGVLRGAFIFMSDLTRRMNTKHQVDFISIGSYDNDKSGDVRLLMDTRTNVSGKHVLIVEDIVDSGKTMGYLVEMFRDKKAETITTCSLLRRSTDNDIDFVGFDMLSDDWVVGYGLDYGDKYRTLPEIYKINPR